MFKVPRDSGFDHGFGERTGFRRNRAGDTHDTSFWVLWFQFVAWLSFC